jgi:hypothetical protein
VVPKLSYKAGQLLISPLVVGHIKCCLAFYYTQVALAIRTTLQKNSAYIKTAKAAIVMSLVVIALPRRRSVMTFIFFILFFFVINNVGCIKHLGGLDVAHRL